MLMVKKCQCFHYFVWLTIRLEIRLNNILDTKKPFFDYKRNICESPKTRIFPKGLTHAFGQKIPILSFLLLVKKRLEIRFNNVLDRKNCFLSIKTKFFKVPKMVFFQRG